MRSGLLFLLLLAQPSLPQQPPGPAAPLPADYAAKREAALAPALAFVGQGDYVAALQWLQPLLKQYPHDLRVLFLAADAARIAGDTSQALDLLHHCLELKVANPGAIHLGLIRTYADLNRWQDVNTQRALVRQMALNGDQSLSAETGYIIEDHREPGLHFQVLEFPSADPATITHYRFLLVTRRRGSAFTPSVDLETNPADASSFAQEYGAQAAAHIPGFALASYPDSKSREFLNFYPNGEPPYEDVRSDVLKFLKSAPVPEPTAQKEPSTRPAYHPPQP